MWFVTAVFELSGMKLPPIVRAFVGYETGFTTKKMVDISSFFALNLTYSHTHTE